MRIPLSGESPRLLSPRRRRTRLRLGIAFAAISLVPLGTAAILLSLSSDRTERQRADLRAESAVRLAAIEFVQKLNAADQTAVSLASLPTLQQALAGRNRAALARFAARHPSVTFTAGRATVAASPPPRGVPRSASVVAGGRALGRVSVFVPFDERMLGALESAAHLSGNRLVLVRNGQAVAGAPTGTAALNVPVRTHRSIELAGKRYRAFGLRVLPTGEEIVALTPTAPIDQRIDRRHAILAFALLSSLLALGLVGYAVAPSVLAAVRERARGSQPPPTPEEVREVSALIGHALEATHDPKALLPVILEATVQATRARGGRLLVDGEEILRRGSQAAGADPLAIDLGLHGDGALILELTPRRGGFSDETRELAHSLAVQAATALENARLHTIVQRQAVTD